MAGTKVCGAALLVGDHLALGDFKGVEETTNIKVSAIFHNSSFHSREGSYWCLLIAKSTN